MAAVALKLDAGFTAEGTLAGSSGGREVMLVPLSEGPETGGTCASYRSPQTQGPVSSAEFYNRLRE